jgi:hypothetical protein
MTTDDPALTRAEAAVAAARDAARPEPEHSKALAAALLGLSNELERLENVNDAHDAAGQAIDALKTPFLKAPQSLAAPMRDAVSRYLELSAMAGAKPDSARLEPIAQALGSVMRIEDDLEDSKW